LFDIDYVYSYGLILMYVDLGVF